MKWKAEDYNPLHLGHRSPASYFEAAGGLVASYLNGPRPREESVERAVQIVEAMKLENLSAVTELRVAGVSSSFDAGGVPALSALYVLWRENLVHRLRQCDCGRWLYAVRASSQTSCSEKCRKDRYERSPEGREAKKRHPAESKRWRNRRT